MLNQLKALQLQSARVHGMVSGTECMLNCGNSRHSTPSFWYRAKQSTRRIVDTTILVVWQNSIPRKRVLLSHLLEDLLPQLDKPPQLHVDFLQRLALLDALEEDLGAIGYRAEHLKQPNRSFDVLSSSGELHQMVAQTKFKHVECITWSNNIQKERVPTNTENREATKVYF